MSLLVLTDIHMSASRPAGRIDDFIANVDTKLQEVADIARELDVEAVLCAGDVFHRAVPALSVIDRFLTFLDLLDKPFITIPGSHDLVGNNLGALYRTAIGLLDRVRRITLLSSATLDVMSIGDFVIGTPEDTAHDIELVHALVIPRPDLFGEFTLIGEYRTKAKVVIVGHYHGGYDLTVVDNTTFVCPGSLVRTIAIKSELTRRPRVAIIHDDFRIEWLELQSALPGNEVLEPPVVAPETDFASIVQGWATMNIDQIDMVALLREVAANDNVSDDVVEYALGMLAK